MKASIYIKELFINDNSRIYFESNDIVVIVGPNNSGKSTLLREMQNLSRELNWISNAKILKGLALENTGTIDDLIEFMDASSFRTINSGEETVYTGVGWNINRRTAHNLWSQFKSNGLVQMLSLFLKHISSDGRLGIANRVQSFDILTENPQHPIHFLYKSDSLESKFSEAFAKAFNYDLIVNRGAGQAIHLHVGKRPEFTLGEDRISESYLKKLQKLPTIQEQGDGMRSFVGLLLEVLLGNQSINLIDEPEVFLHPPQARLLGRMLVTDVPQDKQIFISTHSADFLKGLLDANSDRVKVVRINREENINHVKELTKDQIKETWNDPLLRHSNVLSGLFHNTVVLCEGDMDCRFYSSILDSLVEIDQAKKKEQRKFKSIPDPLFIHCGGKQRMPMVVRSLVKLGVPISVICDFDVLNNTEPLKSIYKALGGDWASIESDSKIVRTQIEAKKPELETSDVKAKIEKILATETTNIFSPKSAEEIRDLLRKTSAWSTAKSVGKSFVPSGDATNAYQRIVSRLNEKSLFIVEVGEVENFDKGVGNHGPKWVNEVLLKDIKTAPEFGQAREFVMSFFK